MAESLASCVMARTIRACRRVRRDTIRHNVATCAWLYLSSQTVAAVSYISCLASSFKVLLSTCCQLTTVFAPSYVNKSQLAPTCVHKLCSALCIGKTTAFQVVYRGGAWTYYGHCTPAHVLSCFSMPREHDQQPPLRYLDHSCLLTSLVTFSGQEGQCFI